MATNAPGHFDAPLAVDPEVWARLEKLAAAAGRSVSDLVGGLLREFIDESEQHLTAIDAGIAAADAGDLIDFDEVEADLDKKLAALAARR
ncbi:MAG: hypothetical protein QM820_65215 [Minicystis sp.]